MPTRPSSMVRIPGRPRRLLLRLALPGFALACALSLVSATRQLEAANRCPLPLTPAPPFHEGLARSLSPPLGELDVDSAPFRFVLEPGETLSGVLEDLGLGARDAHEVSQALGGHVELRKLRAGDPYAAFFSPAGELAAFRLAVGSKGRVTASREGGVWTTSWHAYARSVRTRVAQGSLTTSLEAAVSEAGGRPAVTYRLADALQWDLDFTRDLRVGDSFAVLYEEVYLDGHYSGLGQVVAVHYENRGKLIEAYRFGEDGGLYDGEGRPLRKLFLRSPLRYSRVTSQFSHRRFHPVLKTYRPHYGVDYGAPVGTPVRVTASGTVSFAGWDRGGGNTVKVRHPNEYQTAYLHLSRFAAGVRPGRRVDQGEVVGFVGSTGLATGPHLDYRVKHRGRWINPLSIKSVPASPVAQKDLPEFLLRRDALRTALVSGAPPAELPVATEAPRLQVAESPAPAPEAPGR